MIWNPRKLSDALRADAISEAATLRYLLLFGALYEVIYLMDLIPETEIDPVSSTDVASTIFHIVVWIVGTILCFKTNARGDNRDFLRRYICLYSILSVWSFLPLAIFIVFYQIGLTLWWTSGAATLDRFDEEIGAGILAIFSSLFYVVLNFTIARTSRLQSQEIVAPIAAP